MFISYSGLVMRNYIRYIRYMFMATVANGRGGIRWGIVYSVCPFELHGLHGTLTLGDDVP